MRRTGRDPQNYFIPRGRERKYYRENAPASLESTEDVLQRASRPFPGYFEANWGAGKCDVAPPGRHGLESGLRWPRS
jgi:hypothetical protein